EIVGRDVVREHAQIAHRAVDHAAAAREIGAGADRGGDIAFHAGRADAVVPEIADIALTVIARDAEAAAVVVVILIEADAAGGGGAGIGAADREAEIGRVDGKAHIVVTARSGTRRGGIFDGAQVARRGPAANVGRR